MFFRFVNISKCKSYLVNFSKNFNQKFIVLQIYKEKKIMEFLAIFPFLIKTLRWRNTAETNTPTATENDNFTWL